MVVEVICTWEEEVENDSMEEVAICTWVAAAAGTCKPAVEEMYTCNQRRCLKVSIEQEGPLR